MIICLIICKCQGWDVQLASHMLGCYHMLKILLLPQTKPALHKMLHIYDQFSIKYHGNFIANKSNLGIYDVDETEDDNNKINSQNSNVNVKPNAVHLGNIDGETNENDRIDTCLSEFNRRLNVLSSTFKHAHAHVKYYFLKLLACHCMEAKYGIFLVPAVY